MNAKQMQRWETTQAKGKGHFVWWYGVIGWGFSTAALSSLLDWYLHRDSLEEFLIGLGISIVVFPVGGFLWGIVMWDLGERKYLKAQKANKPHTS